MASGTPLRAAHELFRKGEANAEGWSMLIAKGRRWESACYRAERGRGGFVRCDREEATELIAAATVHAIKEHGPDGVGGFTPIPAMSPVSFAAGTRLLSLIGGHTTTFYDWYADLP